jgi:hypothetical protein
MELFTQLQAGKTQLEGWQVLHGFKLQLLLCKMDRPDLQEESSCKELRNFQN